MVQPAVVPNAALPGAAAAATTAPAPAPVGAAPNGSALATPVAAPNWQQAPGYVPIAQSAGASGGPAPAPKVLAPVKKNWDVESPAEDDAPPANVNDIFADPSLAPRIDDGSAPVVVTGTGALGGSAPAATSVYAPGAQQGQLNQTYVASVSSALSSNDLLVKMTIAGTQQQLAPVADSVRQLVANAAGTTMDNLWWYQTQTVTDAAGQPQLQASILFRNPNAADKAAQQGNLVSRDMQAGIERGAAALGLAIVPGSIRTSSPLGTGFATPVAVAAAPTVGGTALGMGTLGAASNASNPFATQFGALDTGAANTTTGAAVAPAPSPAASGAAAARAVGTTLAAAAAAAAVLLL